MNSKRRTSTRTFIIASALALGLHGAACAADDADRGISPDAGLAKLMAGNARFAKRNVSYPNQDSRCRAEIAKGQKSFAAHALPG